MNLSNELTSQLLNKDKNISKAAASSILNNIDINAWQCLIDNSEYIFDFIKQKIANNLLDSINDNNYQNLFELFKIHSPDWDEPLIQGIIRFSYTDKNLSSKMLELLEKGTEDEKAYAAKYFCYIRDNNAAFSLFESLKTNYEPLKHNSASALGALGDTYSYDYFINKLQSDDEWEKIDAAQFLSWYGNKNAFEKILQAMSDSTMSEYLAGEAALLDDVHKYFDSEKAELKELALECYENLINGLVEIWPLAGILEFKTYESIQKLLFLLKESKEKSMIPRYYSLLLKTKQMTELFINNEQYRFNEDKLVLQELEEIYNILNSEEDAFWGEQQDLLIKEAIEPNDKRKTFAISLIGELKIEDAAEKLKEELVNSEQTESIKYQLLDTLKKLNKIKEINNQEDVISSFNDENLKAAVRNMFV